VDCQAFLRLKVRDKLVQALAGALAEIGNEMTTLRAESENFARSLKTIAAENETEMVLLDEGRARPPFIRQVIPPSRSPRKGKAPAERSGTPRAPASRRFDVWAAENAVDVPEGVVIQSLDVNQALSQLLKPVIDGYQACLGQCDIVRDLRESEELRSELKAVDAAIDPLVQFTDVGPGLAQLHPRKYVAGRLRPNDPLLSHISAVGGQPQIIESADPYRLVFVVPVHDFEAHTWHGFDQSLVYYQADEWSFHTLPEHERLPHLAPESAERGAALKTLGLAFCFELIHVRGANHYMNLLQRPIEGGTGFCYRYYKAEPNAGARAFVEAKVIQMAPPADVRPGKNDPNFMGASLEEARGRLTGPEAVEFFTNIQEIFDDFCSQVGRTRAAEGVRQFIAGELNDWIASATRDSKRQSILREMREELNRFASSLR
jgi:hypothetical protein